MSQENISKFFIPIGKEWGSNELTKCTLPTSEFGKIEVTVNSVYENWQSCHPKKMFNGQREKPPDDYGWTSNKPLPSFVQIDFENPVLANLLSITARTTGYDQSPRSFEIQGSNDDHFDSLKYYQNVDWEPSENKIFYFKNTTPYKSYKIIFTATKSIDVSICELNIGYISFN